jgi:hypothetical protein
MMSSDSKISSTRVFTQQLLIFGFIIIWYGVHHGVDPYGLAALSTSIFGIAMTGKVSQAVVESKSKTALASIEAGKEPAAEAKK